MRYACNGAAVYIGTSLDVLNSLAIFVASHFARDVAAGRVIGTAIFNAQKDFVREHGYTPYLMHGYLFTRIKPLPRSAPAAPLLVRDKIREVLETFAHAPVEEEGEKNKYEAAMTFLKGEIGLSPS